MIASHYGAHEIMEMHEVLTDTIDGINQFQLYRPHCQDPELQKILDNQVHFMTNEYNALVQAMHHRGIQSAQTYANHNNTVPQYGMDQPKAQQPNTSLQQMNDRDVASGMLGCAKSSALLRMQASLECADPEIRQLMIQGANNCAEQAYETWGYMNRNGYYQVPTLKQATTQTVTNTYQPGQQQMPSAPAGGQQHLHQ